MANRYANLVGGNKIRDEYSKINAGFDQVEVEMDTTAKKNAENTFTQRQWIEGANFLHRNGRPQHAWVSTDTNEGVRIEYREDQKILRFQACADMGGFVRHLVGIDRESGEFYITSNNYKAWHEGNMVYEYGTFTPEIFGAGTAGTNTYSTQEGRYIRIANLVYISVNATLSAKDANMSGGVRIRGLPFTPSGVAPAPSVTLGRVDFVTFPSNAKQIVPYFIGTAISMRYIIDGANGSEIQASDLTNNSRIQVTAVYHTGS